MLTKFEMTIVTQCVERMNDKQLVAHFDKVRAEVEKRSN